MLISYLAARVIVLPFDDIATLLTKSNFQISIIAGSTMEDHFKLTKDDVWQRAWKERIEPYLEDYRTYYSNAH